jgi:UDP-4-amino-4,6-dideoxy-N-acetyl-beta-L-altrosamine transaminase
VKKINYGRQDISNADIDAVVDVLRSDFLTQGPVVPKFERAICDYVGASYSVVVNSATSALHIACLALDVGPGDIVWTAATTFVASANCALYCGANIDFVDIEPFTYNISVSALTEKLEQAEKSGLLPKVLVVVHMCGMSSDMLAISLLGERYGFKIIEDASHGLGGVYKGEAVGSCRYSSITVFSFHPVKMITTGEGGAAVTNDANLARSMRIYRSHGITSDPIYMDERPADEIWNYQQIKLGFNYRMTDIQAALGVSQMGRLDEFVRIRNRIAQRYDEELEALSIQLPGRRDDTYSSYHLYVVRVKNTTVKSYQKRIYQRLLASGIVVNLHYIPVYRHPFYQGIGFDKGYCPESEAYFREALSIPIYTSLTDSEQTRVIDALKMELI